MSITIPKKVLIIKVGSTLDTILGDLKIDFEDMIKNNIILPEYKIEYEINNVTEPNAKLPTDLNQYLAIIIPGSHCMVTDHLPWNDYTENWVKNVVVPSGIPLLGICYGHQLICDALGGKVDYNPNGKEVGTVELIFNENCKDDNLFKNFEGKKFSLSVTHSQSIISPPPLKDFYVLTKSECDGFEAVHFTGNIWGTQFHPEFGKDVLKYYVEFTLKSGAKLAKNYVENSYKNVNEDFNIELLSNFIKFAINRYNSSNM